MNTNKLKGLIIEKYGNVKQFAMTINVTTNCLSNILTKKAKPSYQVLKKMYNYLGMSAEEFIKIFFGN